ncbi:hypothetical protein VYU27_007158 [Nannochloropsis oceanica]
MMPVTSWKVAVTAYAATVLLLPHLATALNAVLIGDSILASSDTQGGLGAINKYLNEFSGQKLNNYAKIGSSLHDGRVKSIPQLYQDMRTQTAPAVPSTIVLNGGGNDVISVRDDCWAFNDKCQLQIDSAMEIAEDLMLRMHDDGVQHIIYLGFYYAFNMTQAVDYGTERVKRVCRDAAIDCFVADVRDLDVVVGPDGLHPDDAGYRHLADRIWETKQEYNIPF